MGHFATVLPGGGLTLLAAARRAGGGGGWGGRSLCSRGALVKPLQHFMLVSSCSWMLLALTSSSCMDTCCLLTELPRRPFHPS